MEELLPIISKGWTPGGAGIWVLVAISLIGWWKGLPAVLEALANRQSKVEERMGQLLEDATARFTREIAAADARHEACMEGQEKMQAEVQRLNTCVQEQQATIESLKKQLIQVQVSAIRVDGQPASPLVAAAVASLDRIAGAGE